MFPSFTGSARPKRQVNLSGRSSNPFSAPGLRTPHAPQSVQNALAQAQQERILRQQEREKPPAATKIQKAWRGYRVRSDVTRECRRQWDSQEQKNELCGAANCYMSEDDCLSQLKLLNRFWTSTGEDITRLYVFAKKYVATMRLEHFRGLQWRYPRLMLAKHVIAALGSREGIFSPSDVVLQLLILLESLATDLPTSLVSATSIFVNCLNSYTLLGSLLNFGTLESAPGLLWP